MPFTIRVICERVFTSESGKELCFIIIQQAIKVIEYSPRQIQLNFCPQNQKRFLLFPLSWKMSDQEQQLEEFEVLESIYPEEFSRIDRLQGVPAHWEGQAFGHVFQIDLKPSDADSKEMHGKKGSWIFLPLTK